MGGTADAVAPLERANSLRPNYPPIMTSLGLSYFESNQFDPAIEILTRADQMKPNDRVIQMFLKVAKARKDIVEHFDDLLEKLKKRS
jgi:predicted Zn-dependent protease